jgi:hypothetical protein
MTQLHQIDLVSTKVEDRRIRRTSPQSVLSALQTIEAYNIINATEPSRWNQNLEQSCWLAKTWINFQNSLPHSHEELASETILSVKLDTIKL